MLFHVQMNVAIPHDLDDAERTRLISEEKQRAQDLQREGVWLHLWRVVGQYSNISIFDVPGPDELHDLLWGLPLFPYMQVRVTAIARHPSALPDAERRRGPHA